MVTVFVVEYGLSLFDFMVTAAYFNAESKSCTRFKRWLSATRQKTFSILSVNHYISACRRRSSVLAFSVQIFGKGGSVTLEHREELVASLFC